MLFFWNQNHSTINHRTHYPVRHLRLSFIFLWRPLIRHTPCISQSESPSLSTSLSLLNLFPSRGVPSPDINNVTYASKLVSMWPVPFWYLQQGVSVCFLILRSCFSLCPDLRPRRPNHTDSINFPLRLTSKSGTAKGVQQQEIRGGEERKLQVFLLHLLLIPGCVFWRWLLFSVTTSPVGKLSSSFHPL